MKDIRIYNNQSQQDGLDQGGQFSKRPANPLQTQHKISGLKLRCLTPLIKWIELDPDT